MSKSKKACNCKSKEEVREQIDLIDQELIHLFAKRYEFVKEIVKFKEKTEDAIIAQDRKEKVINQRSIWAVKKGLDKEAYAKLFRLLIDHNISKEMEILNNKS
ncbi:MAG: chorismate mutase [Prolixibacteraceae bacterium]|jgi:isochorismate pyruvate lyase|nr:chorismate mutase [Prolixibacteraceae bacterium]